MAMTLDKLAVIVSNSINDLRADMNAGFADVRKDMATKDDLKEVKQEIAEVNDRLDVIEGKLINNQENRITRLEDEVRVMKTKLETR